MHGNVSVHEKARGHWAAILSAIGIDQKYLNSKHGPCPLCKAGVDRWRWANQAGSGNFFCSTCTPRGGTGVDLVMAYCGLDFMGAKTLIEEKIGTAPPIIPKASSRSDEDRKDAMAYLWGRAHGLDGADLASRYLLARGIPTPSTNALRLVMDLPYFDDAGKKTVMPAMLAKFVAPDSKSAILHRTYLSEPGTKARIGKPRMFMPGRLPSGGAVRLGPAAATLGSGEGLETALSAALINEVTVWAALSTGNLIKWEPPKECENVIIFADRDGNFAGQVAAYSLAHRLAASKKIRVEVRFPDSNPDGEQKIDWNDLLMSQK